MFWNLINFKYSCWIFDFMVSCEMCGYNGDLRRAVVEGTLLMLCDKCIKFGEVVELKRGPSDNVVSERMKRMNTSRFAAMRTSGNVVEEISEELVVKNYSELVKRARERMGKTQEEVAKDIAEKVSIVQGVEGGRLEPSLKLAKKLEQYFKVDLIRAISKKQDEAMELDLGLKPGSMTIGDVIKIKK
jgi:putative transcription factor